MTEKALFVSIFFCILVSFTASKPFQIEDDPICAGYKACPETDPEAINVHLIPHSHDDVGWLKTYQQYYVDSVNHIITTVVTALKNNPERRFIQVETAYFKLWWEEQSESIRQDVINMVNSGQFEIISGAWSMNDEAAVHYQSTIDQFTLGLRYLEDRLGKCSRPKVAWQIDPFGHSREQASLSAQIGFDSLFFARIDFRDKDNRKKTKNMEFIWRASENLGNTSDIFTSVFSNHYHAPSGFCFDVTCNDGPINDNPDDDGYNYEKKIKDFTNFVKGESQIYATNHILTTLGGDMQFTSATVNYDNYDKLIKGFKQFPQEINGKRVNVFYSTPSCYAKSINDYVKTNNVTLNKKTDDFFPHADNANTYWTGYFTSRPASKRYERQGNNLLQIAKQLYAVDKQPYEDKNITSLKEALGVIQHHDAITGTEKQHVANDYHFSLTEGIKKATQAAGSILSDLMSGTDTKINSFELESCLLANISSCPQTDNNFFTVCVYNPLSRVSSTPISLPIDGDKLWIILDSNKTEIVHDIDASLLDFSYAEGITTTASTLDFFAEDIPAMGYKVYQFQSAGGFKRERKMLEKVPLTNGYDDTSFEIDPDTGLLSSVTMNGLTLDIKQDLLYYTSKDQSGAYIFVPTSTEPERIAADTVKVTAFSGNVSRGVVQEFGDWAKQIIRVYDADRSYIEFDWIIGPIDISDKKGKEVITQYTTSLNSKQVFYTDSNGRELIKRTRNSRLGYNYTNEQPIAGNYYPINTRILLRDEEQNIELAILTDRSQGGSSIKDGQLEVMLHRACQHDDNKGVGENLNEQEYDQGIVIRGKHFLVLGSGKGDGKKSLAAIQRDIVQRKLLAPWPFISKKDLSASLKNVEGSNLKKKLPDNVQILTLEPWKEGVLLLRLEHVLEKNEDPVLSQDATVDLKDLFVTFSIDKIEETKLGGNVLIGENERLSWPGSAEEKDSTVQNRAGKDLDNLVISLSPMQIRTFLVYVSYE